MFMQAKNSGRVLLGSIPEWKYTELAVIVFFWDLFWFWNEQNSNPSILLPIAELTELTE